MRREPSIIAAGLALCLSSTLALAQAPPRPGGPPDRPSEAEFAARRQEMEAQRARDFATVLRLRPDQQPALAALLAAEAPPRPPEDNPPRPPLMAETTPQRLEEMAGREAEHERQRRGRDEALRTFYAALTPEQQAAFDALQRLQRPPHGMGGLRGPMQRPLGPPPPR